MNMNKKQIIKISFGILFIGFVLLIVYLFNAEKFYPEYWLQKRIKTFSHIEPLENIDSGGKTLIYKFYDDSGVDIEISLDNNGYVSIGCYQWFQKNKDAKSYTFYYDKEAINNIMNDFKKSYPNTEFNDVDNHLGGHYSTLIYKEINSDNIIEIGFYNVTPDNKFIEMKSKIIRIGNIIISDKKR